MMHTLMITAALASGLALNPAGESARTNLETFVRGCQARQAELSSFHANGKALRAITSDGVANAIGTLVSGGSEVDSASLDSLVDAFVAQTAHRECYDYSIWTSGPRVVVDRVRDDLRDNMIAYLRSLGRDPKPHEALRTERMFVTEAGQTIGIRDSETVTRVEHFTRDRILNRLDFTLVDVSPVLDDALHTGGLTRSFAPATPVPGVGTMVFSRTSNGKTDDIVCTVDMNHGFRPMSVRQVTDGVLMRAVDFLYSTAETGAFPAAVLNRLMQNRDPEPMVTVELFVFKSCKVGDAVLVPQLRLPAVRNEVTETQDGSLMIAREMPSALRSASAESRLAVALSRILDNWGSTDPEYDLDGDGIVAVGDIERAEATF